MRLTPLPLTEAIQQFDMAQVADGLAAGTLQHQRGRARKLEAAAAEWEQARRRPGKPIKTNEVDSQLVNLYLARCKGGDANRGQMMAYLKGVLRYCERNDWAAAGICDKLTHGRRAKPFQRRPKVYVQPEDFPRMLEAQTRHISDRATMALLLWTLCRKSELYALQWKHVDLERRRLRVYRVKTDRWTDVVICPALYEELAKYRLWYEHEMDTALDPDWKVIPELIPHREKTPDTKQFVRNSCWYSVNPDRSPGMMERIVKRGLDAIGITGTVQGKVVNHVGEGAHTIRRSGARAMLKFLSAETGFADALATVAAMLDHKDVKVTLNYIGMERQKAELDEWLMTNNPYGG